MSSIVLTSNWSLAFLLITNVGPIHSIDSMVILAAPVTLSSMEITDIFTSYYSYYT